MRGLARLKGSPPGATLTECGEGITEPPRASTAWFRASSLARRPESQVRRGTCRAGSDRLGCVLHHHDGAEIQLERCTGFRGAFLPGHRGRRTNGRWWLAEHHLSLADTADTARPSDAHAVTRWLHGRIRRKAPLAGLCDGEILPFEARHGKLGGSRRSPVYTEMGCIISRHPGRKAQTGTLVGDRGPAPRARRSPHHFRTHKRRAKSGTAATCDLSRDMSWSHESGRRMKSIGDMKLALQPATKGARVISIRPMSWYVGSHENIARRSAGRPPLSSASWGQRLGSTGHPDQLDVRDVNHADANGYFSRCRKLSLGKAKDATS